MGESLPDEETAVGGNGLLAFREVEEALIAVGDESALVVGVLKGRGAVPFEDAKAAIAEAEGAFVEADAAATAAEDERPFVLGVETPWGADDSPLTEEEMKAPGAEVGLVNADDGVGGFSSSSVLLVEDWMLGVEAPALLDAGGVVEAVRYDDGAIVSKGIAKAGEAAAAISKRIDVVFIFERVWIMKWRYLRPLDLCLCFWNGISCCKK